MNSSEARDNVERCIASGKARRASQIAVELDRSVVEIRYLLRQLESDGRIEVDPAAAPVLKRGRPERVFRVCPAGARQLLVEMVEQMARYAPDDCASTIARALAGPLSPSKNRTVRLNDCVRRLEKFEIQARWQARPFGPLIEIYLTPYPPTSPFLALEKSLIETLTGIKLRLVSDPGAVPREYQLLLPAVA